MELSAADEIIAMDNLEVLRANGFELEVAEDLPVGKRLKLVAQPQSKGTVFDIAGKPKRGLPVIFQNIEDLFKIWRSFSR